MTHRSRDGKEVNEKAVSPLTSTEGDHNAQSMLGDRPMSDIEAKLGERMSTAVTRHVRDRKITVGVHRGRVKC